jgi:hypothetical protein
MLPPPPAPRASALWAPVAARARTLVAAVLLAALLLLGAAPRRPSPTARAAEAAASVAKQYNVVDYTRFTERVAAAASSRLPASCSAPKGAVVISVLTSGFFPFRQLQQRAARLIPAAAACLEPLTVTACLDAQCAVLCARADVRGCVALGNVSVLTRRTPMWTADYRYINLVKLEVLQRALGAARVVFFIDSDVLLFRPPWAAAGAPASAQLRFQTEQARLPGGTACDQDEANGGVLMLSRASEGDAAEAVAAADGRLAAFFAAFFAHRDEIMGAVNMNQTDQAFLLPSAAQAGLLACGLPSDVFVGQCQLGRDGVVDYARIVAYHPTCVGPSKKRRRMLAVMGNVLRVEKERPAAAAG